MSSVLVIGGGHNGLICATYLAKAGHFVRVLESRHLVGGCAVTEELYPGFKYSRASYVQSLLRPQIIKDLELHKHGLKLIPRTPVSSFTPWHDGRALSLGHDYEANRESIAQFSKKDADKYFEFESFLSSIAGALEPLLDVSPPNMRPRTFEDFKSLYLHAKAGIKLGSNAIEAARLMLSPASEIIEEWFSSEPLKGTLGTDAVIGAMASPMSQGTGYVLFHHVMGGIWSYVQGGMGNLSEAIASSARASGVRVECNVRVEKIKKYGNKFEVVTSDPRNGRDHTFFPDAVVSSLDPSATFGLVPFSEVPEEYGKKLNAMDYSSPVVKFNFALDRLPDFKTNEKVPLTGTIHLGALTLLEQDKAYKEAVAGQPSGNPIVELTIPSVLDPTLAPEGKHVASAFTQYAPVMDKHDSKWPWAKDVMIQNVLGAIEVAAPGFQSSILHMDVLTAPDMEETFGLTGGNIFHGAMSPTRLSLFRPFSGWANYETAIPGLFLCGAGTHPGGGVMGAPGRNAAKVVAKKIRRK